MDQQHGRERRRRVAVDCDADIGPAPPELHPAIAVLRGVHRAAHPDEGTILEASSHLLMARDWPVTCPRFLEALRGIGLECVLHLQYIKLDHHLITALAERWNYHTNTFHLPIGEATVTLQDVALILGVCVNGPALIGPNVVGLGRRWESWPQCCDELLGSHPIPNIVYHHPNDPNIATTFKMGQAKAQTCIPLRWLRWTFRRESYVDLDEITFSRHVRAYILFILGSFLIPDTSGSEIHLQYLPLMENLNLFSQYSVGAAVLGHLYRELKESTKPKRVNIAGCLHLLQVWSWERIHVGRPTLLVPYPEDIDEKSIGYRWNEFHIREQPANHVRVYRDEIDGLQPSQFIWEPYEEHILFRVATICTSGLYMWQARVPLINWRRVEWHLPERVARQFGQIPRIDMEPMETNFERVDGRGKVGVDWVQYHARYISLWNDRFSYIMTRDTTGIDRARATDIYMTWYKSWATLYLLTASPEPPVTYYPRSPIERAMRETILETESLFRPFYGQNLGTPIQSAIDRFEEMTIALRRSFYLGDAPIHDEPDVHEDSHSPIPPHTVPASITITDPAYFDHQMWPSFAQPATVLSGSSPFPQSLFYTSNPTWLTPGAGPSNPHIDTQPSVRLTDSGDEGNVAEQHHQLRGRPRRAPDHYTPGSGAIPPRHRRRR